MAQNDTTCISSCSLERFSKIFFLGIGGIGMSAIARFFHLHGFAVAGYDRTPSALTHSLEQEGIKVSYNDSPQALPERFGEVQSVLVVRTPAVPQDSVLYKYIRQQGYTILKRAEVLGLLTRNMQALCVAGTHGKTTTSTMLAHLLACTKKTSKTDNGVNAFLGGISVNYNTNFLHSASSDIVVVEADEYDRSFHHLRPTMAVVTSTDPDHLDIYGTADAYRQSFSTFTSLIRPGGVLLRKQGIILESRLQAGVREFTYAALDGNTDRLPDFYADNIVTQEGEIYFDFHGPDICLRHVRLGVPVHINVENAVAAMAIGRLNGLTAEQLCDGIASFRGTLRRFNTLLKTDRLVLIDDYAHHPDELRQSVCSVRELYPDAELTAVFQPHLYTRTRDFYRQFAASLSIPDRLILLPIYPARELPIQGVSSEMILNEATLTQKEICEKNELADRLQEVISPSLSRGIRQVVLTLGAGDIDRLLPNLLKRLSSLSAI